MFIKTVAREKGMTLMSVLVATALSAIIGLMVIRLMVNQAEAMLMISLSEEREILVKHYRQVVIGGWDKTMASTGASDPTASTSVKIRGSSIGTGAFPLSLRSDHPHNLYTHDPSGSGWWDVDAKIGTPTSSGKIQHSDAYDSSGSGLDTEKNYIVTLTVDFDPTKHPVANMDIATREEIIYMGYRWQRTKQSGCGSDSATALTRRDTTSGTPKPLYHPNSQGAVVSYSFHSNYVKCSQVPLVSNASECSRVSAILGFESWGTATTPATPPYYFENPRYYRKNYPNEYVTGRLACSYPLASSSPTPGSAWKGALGNKRYYTLHDKVWNIAPSPTPRATSTDCPALDYSYVDSVTAITSTGSGGGELTCEPTLIAPQTLTGIARTGEQKAGCSQVSSSGYTWCNTSATGYQGWDGVSTFTTYTHHAGGGGYQIGVGESSEIRSIGHSGGVKEFNSTGSAVAIKPHPLVADFRLRGRPGDRGEHGDCNCKENPRILSACKLP